MSKVNEEDQVQVKEGMVRETIEPECVVPQKPQDERTLKFVHLTQYS